MRPLEIRYSNDKITNYSNEKDFRLYGLLLTSQFDEMIQKES